MATSSHLSLNKTSPQRILVFGGLLLISIGMIFGDIFATFILHPLIDDIGGAMYKAAGAVAANNGKEVINQMMSIGGYLQSKGTKVDAHSHIINLGMFALLLALAQPRSAFSKATKVRLAKIYVTASLILPISVFTIFYAGLKMSPFEHIGWASIVADLAGAVIIAVVFIQFYGIFCYLRGKRNVDNELSANQNVAKCSSSRNLLRAGALMLVIAMSYGYYYAGVELEQIRATEGGALTQIVEGANQKNMDVVNQGFEKYGKVQVEKAVKVAAHVHMNEFGLMFLLLSFIQPLIYLSEKAKQRTVNCLIISGFGLPISILYEMKFGLLAGGFADMFGLVAIVCLFIMLFGVVKAFGKDDAEQATASLPSSSQSE